VRTSGRWTSSKGLDVIFGIDATCERSVETWAALVHPADRAAMGTYFAEDVLGRGRPFDRAYRVVRADTGAGRWVHGRGTLALDASGRPVTMFGTIADISDRHAAQGALRQLAQAVDQTSEAVLITGPTGQIAIVELSPRFLKLDISLVRHVDRDTPRHAKSRRVRPPANVLPGAKDPRPAVRAAPSRVRNG
jgi:PAS domain S-box-containing protein